MPTKEGKKGLRGQKRTSRKSQRAKRRGNAAPQRQGAAMHLKDSGSPRRTSAGKPSMMRSKRAKRKGGKARGGKARGGKPTRFEKKTKKKKAKTDGKEARITARKKHKVLKQSPEAIAARKENTKQLLGGLGEAAQVGLGLLSGGEMPYGRTDEELWDDGLDVYEEPELELEPEPEGFTTQQLAIAGGVGVVVVGGLATAAVVTVGAAAVAAVMMSK